MKVYLPINLYIEKIDNSPINKKFLAIKRIDKDTFSLIWNIKEQDSSNNINIRELTRIDIKPRDYTVNNIFEILVTDKSDRLLEPINSSLIDCGRNFEINKLYFDASASTVSFYVPEDIGKEVYIYSRVQTLVEQDDNVTTITGQYPFNFNDIIIDNFPEFLPILNNNKARLELLLKLDPNNSLSAVEAQLDFVTAMLLTIIENDLDIKEKVINVIKQYSNFKDAFEKTNVFNVKDEYKCYEEVLNGKKLVRDLQTEYYNNK